MNILSLLGDGAGVIQGTALDSIITDSYWTFLKIVNTILPVTIAVLLVIGMFYGIQLGVKYAKADDDEKRKTTRQSLINVVVGVLIAVIFVAIIEIILNADFIKDMFKSAITNSNVAGN